MDGPPILGPPAHSHPSIISPKDILTNDDDRIEEGIKTDTSDDGSTEQAIHQISPLWEHAEAFRRAAILGLIFDESNSGVSSIYSNVIRDEGKSHINIDMRGDDLAVAAAVESGLLVPTRGGAASTRQSSSRKSSNKQLKENEANNPLSELLSWFVRELSAPLAAIPAWHGMFCSYLHEQRQCSRRTRTHWWGRLRGKCYDTTGLDFDASISGIVHVPCIADTANNNKSATIVQTTISRPARVKVFAPKTFRDLRNKCFRVSESEYAQSILNAIDGVMTLNDNTIDDSMMQVEEGDENGFICCLEDDTSDKHDEAISQLIGSILCQEQYQKRNTGKSSITLPYISFQSNSKGAARAGTFFFFTADGAYMIKTVKKEEGKAFLEMLPEYHRFMSERVNGRNSLLTRVFGMYSVRFTSDVNKPHRWNGGLYSTDEDTATTSEHSDDEERVFLVMNSVFPAEASLFVTERFDLKGSTVGRECSLEEIRTKGGNAVLKDLNLKREVESELEEIKGLMENDSGRRRRKRLPYGIHIGQRKKDALMSQLKRDVGLLNRCGVLDYSLLVGVAEMDRLPNGTKTMNRILPKAIQDVFTWMDAPMPYYGAAMTKVDGGHLSSLYGSRKGKHVIYYLGVIDFLQPWTVKKRLERDLKGLAGYDKTAISCVAPSDYAHRFLNFINTNVS